MSNDTSDKGLKDVLKRIGVFTLAILGFFTALLNAIQLVLGNAGLVTVVSLVCIVLTLYVSLFYVRFSKAKSQPVPRFVGRKPTRKYAYSERVRRLASISICILFILTIASLIGWQYQRTRLPDKIIVLVANFQGRDQDYGVTDIIFRQLKGLEKRYKDISVKSIDQIISVKKGGSEVAREIGAGQKASIVIWGSYYTTDEKVLVDIHFEVLSKPESLSLIREESTQTLAVLGLKNFDVQTRLSNEMNYLVLLTAGLTRYEVKDYDGAIARLTEALEHGAVPEQMIAPAGLFFYRGSSYSSKHEFGKAIDDYSKAISLSPDAVAAYNNRGLAYLETANDDNAISDFDKAISLQSDLASIYANRGIAFSFKHDVDRAIADFHKAISLDPNNVVAYVNRGSLYVSIGEFDLAIADFDRAIKRQPNLHEAYNNRGLAYSEKGDLRRAFADFERALQIKHDSPQVYNNLGRSYYMAGDAQRAIAEFDKALKLKPDLALVLLNRGAANSSIGEYDRAIADYSAVIKINPQMAQAYHYRGTCHSEKEEYDLAFTDYDQALKLGRNNAKLFVDRGITYARKGSTDQAITEFNQALALEPKLAEAFFNRGTAYKDKGSLEQASKDFKRVLELTRDPKMAELARARLLEISN